MLDSDVLYGYFVGPPGLVLRTSGTTLTSRSAYGWKALLQATTDLQSPMLRVEDWVSNYTISRIWFHGERFNRRGVASCTSDQTNNLWLRGSYFLIDEIDSTDAPCQSSATVEGDHFEIRNSWFANNGWDEPSGGPWADGLTVWRCGNGYIHHNHFIDNTDIDLVVGGGSNCRVEYNQIEHRLSYGFAGIHVGWFPNGNGNHAGSTYFGNTITSGYDKLAFGLVIGFHPWSSKIQLVDSGRVVDNAISGAVINLAVEADKTGAVVGEVTGNTMWGAQGQNGFGACTYRADYTVFTPHTGWIVLQPDWWFQLQFDDGVCTLWDFIP